MLLQTISGFFENPLHLTTLIVSWALALMSFLYWREHPKARFLYAHLFFLVMPLVDFAVAVPCNTPFVQGLLSFCSIAYTRLLFGLIPVAIMIALVLGLAVIPRAYKKYYHAKEVRSVRFERLARKAGLSGTHFWVLDTARPVAFSFGNNVFVSVGMHELLSAREQDAVVLHELGHVKYESSVSKVASFVARLFSPIAHFTSLDSVRKEERLADRFAVQMQKTSCFLRSAKQKVRSHVIFK